MAVNKTRNRRLGPSHLTREEMLVLERATPPSTLSHAEKVVFLDKYIRASEHQRAGMLYAHCLRSHEPAQWAQAIYGEGLRQLRRQLGRQLR